jgi:hypothetical protein
LIHVNDPHRPTYHTTSFTSHFQRLSFLSSELRAWMLSHLAGFQRLFQWSRPVLSGQGGFAPLPFASLLWHSRAFQVISWRGTTIPLQKWLSRKARPLVLVEAAPRRTRACGIEGVRWRHYKRQAAMRPITHCREISLQCSPKTSLTTERQRPPYLRLPKLSSTSSLQLSAGRFIAVVNPSMLSQASVP